MGVMFNMNPPFPPDLQKHFNDSGIAESVVAGAKFAEPIFLDAVRTHPAGKEYVLEMHYRNALMIFFDDLHRISAGHAEMPRIKYNPGVGAGFQEIFQFLLVFNILLLCVMAIIVFSLSELDKSDVRKLNLILLFFLTVVTLLIDLFALSAIITRLSDGFTPNRTVVLISNILVLINLLLLLPGLFLAGFKEKSLDRVEKIICSYLPVYFLYCVVVIFVFPLVFGMK